MLLLLTTFASAQQPAPAAPATLPSDWNTRADEAQRGLALFWDDDDHLFRRSHPADDDREHFDYWWQAHAIDALVDAFERSKARSHLQRASELWRGVLRKNGGPTNDYFDDMLWMALALQRLAAHVEADTAEQLGRDVTQLWLEVQAGWNEQQGGGIAWRKSQRDYKNTPANAPAVILGVRRYRQHGDARDLAFARRVYDWLDAHLVDAETGFVWDGVNRRGDGKVDRDWAFTYNQGLRIGAAVELFLATKEQRFLDDAQRTFAASVQRLEDEHGVLRERGKGDGALFKGVLLRYVGVLIAVDPAAHRDQAAFVRRQAEAACAQVPATMRMGQAPLLLGPDWRGPGPQQTNPQQPVELAAQLSAVMLLEQMARLGH